MSLRSLLERRAAIAADMRALLPADDADMSPEAAARFDGLKAELDGLEQRIARQSVLEDAERRMQGQPLAGGGDRNLDRELRQFSLVRAIAAQAGLNVDAGRERELSQEIARRAGRPFQGIAVPMSVFHEPVEQRVLTTTAPAAGPGSNIVATDHLGNQFIDILRARLIVRGLGARVLSGLTGNVDIPRLKASATSGWVAENQSLTPSDHQFDKVGLTPKHAGCITEFSRNMLLQSSPDVEALIRADFAAVLARTVDRVAIKGGGSNEPSGVLETDGIGSFSLATVTWSNVLEAIEDLELANTSGAAWATNPKVVRRLRSTLKVSNDAAAGFIMEGPGSLAGYPVASTTLVPSDLGDDNDKSALIFGDWSDLMLGYWSELDVLVNPYEATAYSKGNVQVRAMLTMDVAVRHPASFTAATDV